MYKISTDTMTIYCQNNKFILEIQNKPPKIKYNQGEYRIK